jgi:hypothetical protein
MKKKNAVLVLVALVLAAILVPATSAAVYEGTWFLEADWATACDASNDGSIKLFIDSNVPPGYVTVNTWDAKSAALGHVVSYTTRRTFPSGFYTSAPSFWPVFAGGWTKMTHSVYTPDGKLLTYAYVFADCLTGEIIVGTRDVYSGTL